MRAALEQGTKSRGSVVVKSPSICIKFVGLFFAPRFMMLRNVGAVKLQSATPPPLLWVYLKRRHSQTESKKRPKQMEGSVSPSPTPSPSPGRETWPSGHHPGLVTLWRLLSGTACRGLWEDIWHLIHLKATALGFWWIMQMSRKRKYKRRENIHSWNWTDAEEELFLSTLP